MELAKAYEPKAVEDKWYAEWLAKRRFAATPGHGVPYCITIPPPNITGSLHMGHALNNTIIDAMTRWHRMLGDNAMTLPGTDHAGIATQNVVERQLAKEGLTRHDLGRDAFIAKCWEWRREYGDRIYLQFHKLGCSYDWDRARFTMDDSYVDAIYEEFLRWWERGLIYRGARVVNWCPRCRSAISDIEVNSEERQGRLYHLRYPFADGSGFITIATTRPETMLGDTAVAVNPADARYAGQVGRLIDLPLTGRQIPLIADEYAKMDFGTGAVKVTPAHDLNDFEAGLRNKLPQIVVIGEDGRMTEAAGPEFAGLDRFEARKRVLERMEELGLLVKVEDHTIQTPLCDRCGTVIEPLLSEQWFVEMQPLAAPAIEAVKDGRIRFIPDRYTRIYLDWMEKIQPWCISRQLWWGHRIPVWWTADGRYTAARSAQDAAQKLGVDEGALRQDEDVLDTWFSSALWPHATLGWPRETADLDFWYPTNLLSTAQEIIYLWVARMIMTGLDFMGEIPFRDVYIHATVLDDKGARMSKSKGNGVDPLDLIERYGADALRFYLLQNAGKSQDIKFREDSVRLAGTFCNKLWNASRFVLSNLEGAALTPRPPLPGTGEGENGVLIPAAPFSQEREKGEDGAITPGRLPKTGEGESLAAMDRWILSRMHETVETVNRSLATYDMDDAMAAIYRFLWSKFCDWYVEMVKPRLRAEGEDRATAQDVLAYVLETTLRLMHPMIPFITEELWHALPHGGDTIMTAPYPTVANLGARRDLDAEAQMAVVEEAVRGFRNLRAELKLDPARRLPGAAVASDAQAALALNGAAQAVMELARLSEFEVRQSAPSGDGQWVGSPVAGSEVFLEIGEALDLPKERERIAKEVEQTEKELSSIQARLANPQFLEKAAAAVVEKARAQAVELEERREKLLARRHMLGA